MPAERNRRRWPTRTACWSTPYWREWRTHDRCQRPSALIERIPIEPQLLLENVKQERRILKQVTPPALPGLLDQTIEPFKAHARDPGRGSLQCPRLVINRSAQRQKQFHIG